MSPSERQSYHLVNPTVNFSRLLNKIKFCSIFSSSISKKQKFDRLRNGGRKKVGRQESIKFEATSVDVDVDDDDDDDDDERFATDVEVSEMSAS